MKIFFLCQYGSRFNQMIKEGLQYHSGIDWVCSQDYISLGKTIKKRIDVSQYEDAADQADRIFVTNPEHLDFNSQIIIDFFRYLIRKKYLKKTVMIDFKDSINLDRGFLNNCKAYFKRAVYDKRNHKYIPEYNTHSKLYSLNYAALSEYFYIDNYDKEIDVGCFFHNKFVENDRNRRLLLKTVSEYEWSENIKKHIGQVSNADRYGRNDIMFSPKKNGWIDYMKKMKKTKVIFNSFPEYFDGDSRMWESLSSKALCVLDETYMNTPNYFNENEVIFYKAGDKNSIENACDRVNYLLQNDQKTLDKMSKRAYNKVVRYHKPLNRINYILERI